ncbi:hypothetical protein KSS87_005576 [Heliosperma pusillum]|nr:hypothetical protein KSS87_005576 [Heliosperma pusillum]
MSTFYKLGLSFFSCPFSDYIYPSFNLLSMVYVWRMSNFFLVFYFYFFILIINNLLLFCFFLLLIEYCLFTGIFIQQFIVPSEKFFKLQEYCNFNY